ncbi:Pycsar system effector family protein [Streptomyces uncialis]|uniref:Pycsar system effector family protein n=1 Tax=Streptomyces uncialis TaxID=1048205 RepID=UPI00379CF4FE
METDTKPDTDIRLRTAISTVLAEVARADAKAGILLAAYTLPLTVILATVPGRSLPHLAGVLIALGTGGLVAAMLLVLLVVRPSITGARRGTFLYWARCTPQEAAADVAATGTANLGEDLVRLSKLARRKFLGLRWAVDITAVAFIALTAGLLISL